MWLVDVEFLENNKIKLVEKLKNLYLLLFFWLLLFFFF
jgi:hypothetical protein